MVAVLRSGSLTDVNASDGGGFSVDDSGAFKAFVSDDGGSYTLAAVDDQTVAVSIDDPELGQLTVTASLEGYPELASAFSTDDAALKAVPGQPVSEHVGPAKDDVSARDLDDFEELDLTTFCQITNACALSELYTELFLDDVVDMIQSDLIIIPRAIIQGRIDKAMEAQREFCQEWNAVVFELDDNPCTSSDDPPDEDQEPQDCSANGECNTECPDTEPDPDCSNAAICGAKGFCCEGDQVCDIQRCNELDPDCTNFLFCDRLDACCDDDDRCDTSADGLACPTEDADCSFCGVADDVCIEDCVPADPDCPDSENCATDEFCEQDCAGVDPDCALCAADESATCVSNCELQDPDCTVVANITGLGFTSSSSVFENRSEFRASLGADGSTGTNWFSDGEGGGGPDSDSEVFSWTFSDLTNTSMTSIQTDPETFEGGGGFGFAGVQVLVQDVSGATVYDSGFLTMSGFQVDIDISLPADTEGRTVILTLISHQDSSCGGFSEFRVFGLRDISESQ